MIDKDDVKTAQPFSDDTPEDVPENMTGGAPKPRQDTLDDKEAQKKVGKMTQRQE